MKQTINILLCLLSALPVASMAAEVKAVDMDRGVRVLSVNDISLPTRLYGAGTPVLLLHGFPDSRHVWRYQLQALADAGFQVIAPDQRGFGEASRPEGVENYKIRLLAADMLGLMDALSIDKAHLVGHDFGASLAWYLAAYHPQRFYTLTVMSVGVFGNPGWDDIRQREASWYFDFFNKVGLAEQTLMANDWKFFKALLRHGGDQARFLRDLSRPGALTAALNWYRANTRGWGGLNTGPIYPLIDLPVMGIWSSDDPFLLEPQMQQSVINVSGSWRYERIEDAGHWLMLERPAELNALLIDFLQSNPPRP